MRSQYFLDPHSHYRAGHPTITHIEWFVTADFGERILRCRAELTFDRGGDVVLDTKGLEILGINDNKALHLAYAVGKHDETLGAALTVSVPTDTPTIVIDYKTTKGAHGLQWLTKEQTGTKTHEFLFSQGQAINTRSYLPCQDTPQVRFTHVTHLTVPSELRGLVSANRLVGIKDAGKFYNTETWAMDHPVPSYLVALAVGRLERRDLTDRAYVVAEPHLIDAAAAEFEDLPKMMEAAEALAGPFPWGTCGILVMPSSFPYGGMENPCLMFVTPALVAGDKSAISTIAHELAHSWTGNLVTNASQREFFINEGWTVYFEGRIVEALFGVERKWLGRALLEREFLEDLKRPMFAKNPLLSVLAPDLEGIDPDELFWRGPYFKGAMLLETLEDAVGRKWLDGMFKLYMQTFRFQSITTLEFLNFLGKELMPGAFLKARVWEWVYEPGYPDNAVPIVSTLAQDVLQAVNPNLAPLGDAWDAQQWVLYFDSLPDIVTTELVDELYGRGFAEAKNVDVRAAFLMVALRAGYDKAMPAIEHLLLTQGRLKYLLPVYRQLATSEAGRTLGKNILERAAGGYHPVAATQAAKILAHAA